MTKLGYREKKMLLVMLGLDDPPGSPIIWGKVFKQATGDYYADALPKKEHRMYMEERKYKRATARLTKKGLVKVVIPKGGIAPPKNRGYQLYRLTEAGRRVAEELNRGKDVEQAVQLLATQGYKCATFNQIRELLWRLSHDKFNSREKFEKYWNKTRLGLTLRRLGVKRIRKRLGGRVARAYLL